MLDVPDDGLMLMYRDGDEAAFRTLFDRYRALVYNFARMMLNDAGRAEDVLQETFLSVARAAGRYEPRNHFRPWLMRIVRNRCLNYLESERVRRSVAVEAGPGILDSLDWPSPKPSPAELVETAERLTIVRRAISKLPERQREAIALYAFDSMTYREVADALEMPLNTVKTMIHRGRAALARALEDAERGEQ